jgi:hypothetical protein
MATVNAIKAQITLGNLLLDVYQLPDGAYCFSRVQLAELCDMTTRRIGQILDSNRVKTLQGIEKNEKLTRVKYEGGTKPFDAISLDTASVLFGVLAKNGNEVALDICIAAMAESLETRADAAFGVQRTAEERNNWFAIRMKSKSTRRAYTDILKERIVELEGVDAYADKRAYFFKEVTVAVNMALFGQPHFNCNRDNMDEDQLTMIEMLERMVAKRALKFPEATAEEIITWCVENI